MSKISDVAKRAGVSPVTVSRVINNAKSVSPATREKVQQAIEQPGYFPNVVARTRALALLVPDITNPFWTSVACGVEDAVQGHSYSVLLCNADESPAKQLRYLDVVAGQRVDGAVIAPCDSTFATCPACALEISRPWSSTGVSRAGTASSWLPAAATSSALPPVLLWRASRRTIS